MSSAGLPAPIARPILRPPGNAQSKPRSGMNDIASIALPDYGAEEAAMRAYCGAGAEKARTLGNRGPIRYTAEGRIHPDILDAYWRVGFYVFEGVLKPDELADIESDIKDILSR